MIQDINKIYVESNVKINGNTMPILCFVDGKAVDNSLYSLANNELNIYLESTEYLTLSYGYNDAKVYHYNVLLNDYGVIIEKYDNSGIWLQNLKINQILVFVDGRLLDKDEFEYISPEAIALKLQIKDDKYHNVIIYSCNGRMGDGFFVANPGDTIECNYSRDRYLIFKNGYLIPNDHIFVSTGNESIKINYNYIQYIESVIKAYCSNDHIKVECNKTQFEEYLLPTTNQKIELFYHLIDESGEESGETPEIGYWILDDNTKIKLADYGIEIKGTPQKGDKITILYTAKIPVDKIRYIVLPETNQTINFKTEKGFLSYGPVDDNKKDVPLRYDYELTFDQNVINLIDDIRTGFILHAEEYNSDYLIVDNNFNKKNIKALSLNNDFNKIYTSKEYYLLVPENRSIVEYLSEFDQKGTLIPEVLEIFQRFLLDEFHDEVERLRNIRNLSKVDSLHINKLLKLLGNKIDLRNKTLLQKRALLEELNSFYRTKGTLQSYNIFNVVDTDIGLTNIEQLFTIRNNASPKTDNVISKVTIDNIVEPGSGYQIGQEYQVVTKPTQSKPSQPTDVKIKVTNVEADNGIKSAAIMLPETVGKVNITSGNYLLSSTGTNALFNISSQETYYKYSLVDYTGISPSSLPEGYSITCQTSKYPGVITFTKKNGQINHKISITKGSSDVSTRDPATHELVFEKAGKVTDNISASLHCDIIKPKEYVFSGSVGSNAPQKVHLPAGIYYFEMSGGGGAGGAADSTIGDTADITSFDGSNGEYKTGLMYLPQDETVDIYIGGGAKGSYARGHDPHYCGSAGAGYTGAGAAKEGTAQRKPWEYQYWVEYKTHSYSSIGSPYYTHKFLRGRTEYDTLATGSGGGASAIVVNGSVKGIARGGKGGDAYADHVGTDAKYSGGIGGGGYYYSETNVGAKGGKHSYPNDTFTSEGGQDGWVRIKKCDIKYTVILDTPIHENAVVGSKYKTNLFSTQLPSTAHIDFEGPVGSEISNIVLDKSQFEQKMGTTTGDYVFLYNGMDWTYNGGMVILPEYGITYDGIPITGDKITVHYTAKFNDFDLEVTAYDQRIQAITGYKIKPKNGENYFTYKDGKILVNDFTNGGDIPVVFYPEDSNIYVKIDAIPTNYAYSLQLDEITTKSMGYAEGDVLTFVDQDTPIIKDFVITVDSVTPSGTITQFHYEPTSGENSITATGKEATREQARGAEIYIKVESQTMAEVDSLKEYVDFFNKEELGAVHKTEYRIPITDYGSVMDGTPKAPYPWTLGEADEDFGFVNSDQNLYQIDKTAWEKEVIVDSTSDGYPYRFEFEPQHYAYETMSDPMLLMSLYWGERQDREYGYVTEEIKGKWYQWWEWTRDPNYYPTNHVEVTLTPKNTGDIADALERFFSQFYKIASTVLYIHRIILNYSFGNTTAYSQNSDGTNDGAVLFGFMSGQPITYDKHYLNNDPMRQNII